MDIKFTGETKTKATVIKKSMIKDILSLYPPPYTEGACESLIGNCFYCFFTEKML